MNLEQVNTILINTVAILQDEINRLKAELPNNIPEITTPAPAVASAFTGNWNDMAQIAMGAYVNPKSNKPLADQKKILAEFKRAIAGNETNASVEELWVCINKYTSGLTQKMNTKCKKCGNIKTCTNRLLHIENDHEFETRYSSWIAGDTAEKTCKVLQGDELDFLKCDDGAYCTIEKMRCVVAENADLDMCGKVLTSLFCHHGNRSQDWLIEWNGLGSSPENADRGYYDKSTNEVHLFKGKQQFSGVRIIKLKQAVVDVLEPDVFNEFIRGIRNTDNPRTAFLHAMGELGLPRITPNQMRHLYETHIRYTDKLTNEQLKDEWEEIGHSEGVARKFYGELYKHILN